MRRPSDAPRRKIVVVDDEAAIREGIAECLEAEGYAVRALAGGAEALAALRDDAAALVLVDLVMPAMNGLELVERLRADPELCSVPVILMTAAIPRVEDRPVALDAILRKPFDLDDLLATVARHCAS